MNNRLLFIPEWHTIGTISTPNSNYKSLYPKANDNHWYFVDSDGSEKRIETALDIRNGITTTTYATSSIFRARLDIALGTGLTFSGNFAGSTISVFGVTPTMLSSLNIGTAGYVLTSNGTSFNWVPTASISNNINGTTNKLAKFSTSNTIGDSLISDDGTKIVLGVTPSFAVGLLNVDGNMYLSGYLYLSDSTNTYLQYSNGILVQTDEDIIFRDELGYNYLDLKTDNISSYTFSILESTILLGDNGTFSYLLANDINSVTFGTTSNTMTFSIFSNSSGALRIKDSSQGANKVFISDSEGYGRWQNLRAGSGLTVSGITYSVNISGTGLTLSSNSLQFDYTILGSTLTQSLGIIDLNNSGVTAGVYGTAGQFVRLTVDSYGRVTNVGFYTQSISGSSGTGLTAGDGLSVGLTNSLNVNTGNGLSIINNNVAIGGTISQLTIIDVSTQSFAIISAVDLGIPHYYGLVVENTVSQLGYTIQGSTISRFDSDINSVSMLAGNGSGQFSLSFDLNSSEALLTDSFNNKGLVYGGNYSPNFTTYSLVDKSYVDTQISGLTLSGGGITEIIAGLGLTGGGTSSPVTLTVNVNSDSLEIVDDVIRLTSTISSNRLFTGGVTISNNFSVTGSTVLNNLTASNTYISSTGSNTLTLYSSGTGSTIFRVQGRSGELFSVTDGLTGSLFSVNDISGLPILEVFSDDTIVMGDYSAPSLYTTAKVITVTGSNVIYSIPTSTYTGAFINYTVSNGANLRSGIITSVWYGITVSYNESTISEIGTTGLSFSFGMSGSNAVLSASSSTNNWTIKTIIKSI